MLKNKGKIQIKLTFMLKDPSNHDDLSSYYSIDEHNIFKRIFN